MEWIPILLFIALLAICIAIYAFHKHGKDQYSRGYHDCSMNYAGTD